MGHTSKIFEEPVASKPPGQSSGGNQESKSTKVTGAGLFYHSSPLSVSAADAYSVSCNTLSTTCSCSDPGYIYDACHAGMEENAIVQTQKNLHHHVQPW